MDVKGDMMSQVEQPRLISPGFPKRGGRGRKHIADVTQDGPQRGSRVPASRTPLSSGEMLALCPRLRIEASLKSLSSERFTESNPVESLCSVQR